MNYPIKSYGLLFILTATALVPLFAQTETQNSPKKENVYHTSNQAPWLVGGQDIPLEQNRQLDSFVDLLMGKMTLSEKIGQLNLASVGFDVTGPLLSKDVEAKIDAGLIGGVFNTFTPIAV
jgi:beta-glucosidase